MKLIYQAINAITGLSMLASGALPAASAVAGATSAVASAVTQYWVAPKTTDPTIDNWLEPHHAYINNGVQHNGYLYLFLPGSYGWASGQDEIQEQAANDGFLGITLRYPNSWTVNDMCGQDTDLSCFETVRMEIIDGTDRTPKVTITRANSIENRLIKLLQYLDKAHPADGWGQFLTGDAINWEKIVVAGHSQGSGHAAMIAKVHKVARVEMFGGPTDFNVSHLQVAPWLHAAHATPTSAYYAFNHAQDSIFLRKLAWRALGMDALGAPVNVDNNAAPYNNSHELITNVATSNPHGSVVVDSAVPLKNGQPVFNAVWQYMSANLAP